MNYLYSGKAAIERLQHPQMVSRLFPQTDHKFSLLLITFLVLPITDRTKTKGKKIEMYLTASILT